MILNSIKYVEHQFTGHAWYLDEFMLGSINLLVGKNASGKTRTISLINALANLVCGDMPFQFSSGQYEVKFYNNADEYQYFFKYDNFVIAAEKLSVNGNILLNRSTGGKGDIYAEELKTNIKFQVPDNQLACVARRDDVQHSFFQPLYQWGRSTLLYNFGTSLGRESLALIGGPEKDDLPNVKDSSNVISIFKHGFRKYGDSFKTRIIDSMHKIGYEIEDIGIGANPNIKIVSQPALLNIRAPLCLFVKENDITDPIYQTDLSQGMFRCLSLLIQLHYSQMASTPHLLLIDDIGEGLDYLRSTALIKVLIDIANKSAVQLVMSSNDRFIMNNVPLIYWSVIQRSGGSCKVFNYQNSKEMFDEFAYTGLSNFDFFATDFPFQDDQKK